MQQVAVSYSHQKVATLIEKIRIGWKKSCEFDGAKVITFTYLCYRHDKHFLREAYQALQNDPDFQGLYFAWNKQMDDTRSVGISISTKPLPEPKLCLVVQTKRESKKSRDLFPKKAKRKRESA